jgi:hypothetical protein
MATTDDGYIDVSDDDTYDAFDEHLVEGKKLAREVDQGIAEARRLAVKVRDGEMTMEEYDDHESIEDVSEAIEGFVSWARGGPAFE